MSAKLDYVLGRENVRNSAAYLIRALIDSEQVSPRNLPAKPLSARGAKLGAIRDAAASRSPTQRDADKRLFGSRLEGSARADFERHGWMSALNHDAIEAFWEDLSPGLFDRVGADS